MVLAMSALLTKMPPAIESVLQETHMAEPLAPLRIGCDKRIIRTGVMLKKQQKTLLVFGSAGLCSWPCYFHLLEDSCIFACEIHESFSY